MHRVYQIYFSDPYICPKRAHKLALSSVIQQLAVMRERANNDAVVSTRSRKKRPMLSVRHTSEGLEAFPVYVCNEDMCNNVHESCTLYDLKGLIFARKSREMNFPSTFKFEWSFTLIVLLEKKNGLIYT